LQKANAISVTLLNRIWNI